MIELWLVEFLKGIGRFFLHPLFYYLAGFAIVVGFLRIKRERQAFNTRIFDIFHEIRSLLPIGVGLGLAISILTIGLGIVIPLGTIITIGLATVILSLTFKLRWISPSYSLGMAFFAVIFLSNLNIESEFLQRIINDLKITALPAMAILLAMLVIAEGILIYKNGPKGTSPQIEKSKRGLPVGAHIAQRLWMVPVFLILPGGVLTTQFEWWPLFSINGGEYALILVPFGIGFHNKAIGMLPAEGIRFIGKRVIALGIVVSIAAVSSLWYPVMAIIAVGLALIGREALAIYHRLTDDSLPFIFSKKEHGLMILGLIPQSPADKMGLQVGEIITKVNSLSVSTESEFYMALQKNRAYCKLGILDTNGEVRFVQRALYDGEHHELGILFVHDDKKWDTEAV